MSFKEYLKQLESQKKLRVIVSINQAEQVDEIKQILDEAKKAKVGRYTAYKHQPHFQGGEYHGHSEIEKGYQVSWTVTAKRLHPNKFPADDKIPKGAKAAVAKVLGLEPSVLESFFAYDEVEQKDVILFELKNENKSVDLLEKLNQLISEAKKNS